MKKIILILILVSLLLIPELAHATSMAGTSDYAIIVGVFGMIVGLVLALITVFIHHLVTQNKLSQKKNFQLGLSIFIGVPAILLIIFFSL